MPPINYVGILAAAVAAWLVGAAWYGVLGKQWMAALGWTEADMAGPDGKRRSIGNPVPVMAQAPSGFWFVRSYPARSRRPSRSSCSITASR